MLQLIWNGERLPKKWRIVLITGVMVLGIAMIIWVGGMKAEAEGNPWFEKPRILEVKAMIVSPIAYHIDRQYGLPSLHSGGKVRLLLGGGLFSHLSPSNFSLSPGQGYRPWLSSSLDRSKYLGYLSGGRI